MKSGKRKNFIYTPSVGWIEAGATPEDAMERIKLAEMNMENENMKILKKIKKRFPHARIRKVGNDWIIEQSEELGE